MTNRLYFKVLSKASLVKGYPRVASLAPSGQFTFRGTAQRWRECPVEEPSASIERHSPSQLSLTAPSKREARVPLMQVDKHIFHFQLSIFNLHIQSQLGGLEPGADIFGRGDDGGRQQCADLDGLAQGFAVGQADGHARAECIKFFILQFHNLY